MTEPDPTPDGRRAEPDLPSNPSAAEGRGFGPSDIPDPMPEALREHGAEEEESEAMDGESPTG
jgi:hypothetical protein